MATGGVGDPCKSPVGQVQDSPTIVRASVCHLNPNGVACSAVGDQKNRAERDAGVSSGHAVGVHRTAIGHGPTAISIPHSVVGCLSTTGP
jgi:hypothetical protein